MVTDKRAQKTSTRRAIIRLTRLSLGDSSSTERRTKLLSDSILTCVYVKSVVVMWWYVLYECDVRMYVRLVERMSSM